MIVVTGALGFIGSCLISKLNAEGIPAAYGGKWSASSIKYVLDKESDI